MVKRYVIYHLYVNFSYIENWKIIFQIVLFVYFQIYGKIFFSIITAIYQQEMEDEKNEGRFLFFIKYYVCDLICSFLVIPLIRNEKIEFILFGIFNFSFQLISIYYKPKPFLIVCASQPFPSSLIIRDNVLFSSRVKLIKTSVACACRTIFVKHSCTILKT